MIGITRKALRGGTEVQNAKLKATVLVLIIFSINSCMTEEKVVTQIGPIQYDRSWSKCNKAAECTFKFDSCNGIYFVNKKHETDLMTKLNSGVQQICVNIIEIWDPVEVVCKKGQCAGIFQKKK